ncbi:MAG: alpha/beta hydrolase [Prochlorothrix sp.]|nr:alpha/beta hydrolase [Prochlorothrix sp.]
MIAYHGWGFSAECWYTLARAAQQESWDFRAYDRGYFALPDPDPRAKTIDSQSRLSFSLAPVPKLLLTHSYGLHLCPPDLLAQATALVVLSGFVQFHPTLAVEQRRSRRRVDRMIQQLQQNPAAVLQQFWINTVAPQSWHWQYSPLSAALSAEAHGGDSLVVAELLRDLCLLQDSVLNLRFLQGISRILVIQGSEDTIVPLSQGEALVQDLIDLEQPRVTFKIIDGAGHGLPLTHGTACWDMIRSWWSVDDDRDGPVA